MSPEETPQRTECPDPDGELTIIYEGVGGQPEYGQWPYPEIKSLQYTNAVVDIHLTNNYQHCIPLSRIVEIVNRGNSDEWLKARDAWMEQDHPHHEGEEQPYCTMCMEMRQANQSPILRMFGYPGEAL